MRRLMSDNGKLSLPELRALATGNGAPESAPSPSPSPKVPVERLTNFMDVRKLLYIIIHASSLSLSSLNC